MTRIGIPSGEEGRGRATNHNCVDAEANAYSMDIFVRDAIHPIQMAGRYAHAREGTNRREWHFATNHGKTQHQNTQIENKKSPPWGDSWLRSQSFIRSLYLCQYLYHYVRYLSSNVEIICVRYLLHMSIFLYPVSVTFMSIFAWEVLLWLHSYF